MPRLNRRRKPRVEEVTPRVVVALMWGHSFPFLDGPDLDGTGLRVAWLALREDLLTRRPSEVCPALDDDAVEPFPPGHRCWGWWKFDAPEPREQVNPGPEPIAGSELFFGLPRCFRGVPPDDVYESDPSYLQRLNLLTLDERQLAAKLRQLFADGAAVEVVAEQTGLPLSAVGGWREAFR